MRHYVNEMPQCFEQWTLLKWKIKWIKTDTNMTIKCRVGIVLYFSLKVDELSVLFTTCGEEKNSNFRFYNKIAEMLE